MADELTSENFTDKELDFIAGFLLGVEHTSLASIPHASTREELAEKTAIKYVKLLRRLHESDKEPPEHDYLSSPETEMRIRGEID